MDETPWAQLASLALFKLFNDWQAQGHVLPPELLKPLELPVTNLNLSQSSMDSETEEVSVESVHDDPQFQCFFHLALGSRATASGQSGQNESRWAANEASGSAVE